MKALTSIKKFYVRNERKILVTTAVVATTAAVLMRTGIKQHNDFLKEHDLYEEFYALDEE
jgi:hypothetical protein